MIYVPCKWIIRNLRWWNSASVRNLHPGEKGVEGDFLILCLLSREKLFSCFCHHNHYKTFIFPWNWKLEICRLRCLSSWNATSVFTWSILFFYKILVSEFQCYASHNLEIWWLLGCGDFWELMSLLLSLLTIPKVNFNALKHVHHIICILSVNLLILNTWIIEVKVKNCIWIWLKS